MKKWNRNMVVLGVIFSLMLAITACGKIGEITVEDAENDVHYWETEEEVESESTFIPEIPSTQEETEPIVFTEESSVEETEEKETFKIKPVFLALTIGSNEESVGMVWEATYNDGEFIRLYEAEDFDKTKDFVGSLQASKDGKVVNYYTKIDGLEAGKKYGYQVRREEEWSKMYYFTAKKPGNTFNYLLAGDPQLGSDDTYKDLAGWRKSVSRALQITESADFILSLGDQVDSGINKHQFDAFFDVPALKNIPIATILGNHEMDSKYYGKYFIMPNLDATRGITPAVGPSSADYTFTYGDTLFLCLNTNNENNEEHKSFMKNAIETYVAANGQRPRWIIANMHHSIFSITDHSESGSYSIRQTELSNAFTELGVDLVFMGHDHVYNRTFMMTGNTPEIIKDEKGQRPLEAVSEDGKVLYFTLNSSSGSKFYEQENIWPETAHNNQEEIPNMTNVEVSEGSIVITTYRMEDGSKVDQFILWR